MYASSPPTTHWSHPPSTMLMPVAMDSRIVIVVETPKRTKGRLPAWKMMSQNLRPIPSRTSTKCGFTAQDELALENIYENDWKVYKLICVWTARNR